MSIFSLADDRGVFFFFSFLCLWPMAQMGNARPDQVAKL